MNWWMRLALAGTLSILYAAYLIEMYRHLTRPLKPLHHQNRKKKMKRLIFFFVGIVSTILIAYAIRQFVIPKPTFDLIVASLQIIFIIPFFGAILTDRLLHAWRSRRLPYSISVSIIIFTALIGAGTNLLILFATQETIKTVASILDTTTDITAICVILVLAFLGIGYWQSTKK